MNYSNLLIAALSLYLIPCFTLFFKFINLNSQVNNILITFGLIAHGLAIYLISFNDVTNLNFANSFLLISWVIVFIFWVINKENIYNELKLFTLIPAIFILLIFPLIQQNSYSNDILSINALMHIIVAIISHGLLAFGAIFSLYLLLFEKKLNANSLKLSSDAGSLLPMEKTLFTIYWLGFLLLSATLISGILFSNDIFGNIIIWNHKLIFSIIAWVSYGWLLFGRIFYGWRGKKAILISLVAFAFLFLSYLGTKFVIEFILNK